MRLNISVYCTPLLAAFWAAVEARPGLVTVGAVRSLLCPFEVSADSGPETLYVTYDTSNPTFGASDDVHACSLQIMFQFEGRDTAFITDIDYSGDVEAEIETLVAWNRAFGPVRFNNISLGGADTPVQRATNTTIARASVCESYYATQSAYINIKTIVQGNIGGVIKQALNLQWYGHCLGFGCEHELDIVGDDGPYCPRPNPE